jgi:DNA phosphorothioation-dependent restriction protein DptG
MYIEYVSWFDTAGKNLVSVFNQLNNLSEVPSQQINIEQETLRVLEELRYCMDHLLAKEVAINYGPICLKVFSCNYETNNTYSVKYMLKNLEYLRLYTFPNKTMSSRFQAFLFILENQIYKIKNK